MSDPIIAATTARKRPPTKVLVRTKPGRPKEKLVKTEADLPDLEVIALPELQQALIRAARTFIQTFLGALGVLGVSDAAGPGTISAAAFGDQALGAAMVAAISALIAFLWNAGELLARLDNPKIRG
jgi:hypothetical protein